MKYKLLKDLPGYKAGTVIERLVHDPTVDPSLAQAGLKVTDPNDDVSYDGPIGPLFHNHYDNSDWFQPINEQTDGVDISLDVIYDTLEVTVYWDEAHREQAEKTAEAIRAVLAYIQTPWGGYHGLDQADTPQWGSEPEKAIIAARAAVQKGRN